MLRGMAVPRRTVELRPSALAIWVRRSVRPRPGDVLALERSLERTLGIPHVVATASGRSALAAIVEALGLAPGSEVIIPAYTDRSVPATLRAKGHGLRYSDADALDANPDPGRCDPPEGAGAVVAAHHFGRMCDLDGWASLAERAGLPLVEDATHALGATWRGRPAGSVGAAGYLSFNVTKPFTALGGGAVLTGDPALAREVRAVVDRGPREPLGRTVRRAARGTALWAATRRTVFGATLFPVLRVVRSRGTDVLGTYRSVANRPAGTPSGGPMSPASASLALAALPGLADAIERRQERAAGLDARLSGVVEVLRDRPGSSGVAYFYVVLDDDPGRLGLALLARGIDTGHHLMDIVAPDADRFPGARLQLARSVQLPIHPGVRPGDLDRIAEVVLRHVDSRRPRPTPPRDR